MIVTFHGTRGAYPIHREGSKNLGGLTNCVEVREAGSRIILDAGSGLTNVEPSVKEDIIILSHFHLDHLIGLPEFLTRKKKGRVLIGCGLTKTHQELKNQLDQLFGSPFFPVRLDIIYPSVEYHSMDKKFVYHQWLIEGTPLNHPGGATGYKITDQTSGKSVTHLMDHEHGSENDIDLKHFSKDTDLLIWDGCYNEAEYVSRRGFGHSTWEAGVHFAAECDIGQLVISGHSVDRSDAEALEIGQKLQGNNDLLAYDGLQLEV